ncbi:hypothetical protein D3C80_1234030 [compost metagenome]
MHDQHRVILIINHDRNPLRAGQGAQAFNLDRCAKGRAGGAAQADRGRSLAHDQLRVLAQRIGKEGERCVRRQGADCSDPARMLGVRDSLPFGQDDEDGAVVSDILDLVRLGVCLGREHQKTVDRFLGQNATVHHHRHAKIAQKIR